MGYNHVKKMSEVLLSNDRNKTLIDKQSRET